MPKLDSRNVPPALASLLPLAEKWGIGDDLLREEAVDAAADEVLRELVGALAAVDSEFLFGWLAGPESHRNPLRPEYVALSNLMMAIDVAKVRLRQRSKS